MSVTIFSFIMSVLWCDVFTIMTYFLFKKKNFIIYFSISTVLFMILLSFFRLVFSMEFPFMKIIRSETLFPAILGFLKYEPFFFISKDLTMNIADLFVTLWILGTIYFIYGIFMKHWRTRILLRREPLTEDPHIYDILNQVMEKPVSNVRIVQTPFVSIPMISGYFHPTIYLPKIAFSDSELYYILCHEWNHYLHKDIWIKLLINITCAIYWWNPLIYLLRHDLNNFLEIKSDYFSLKALSEKEKIEYLESIIKVAKHIDKKSQHRTVSPANLGLVGLQKGEALKQRFHYVLDWDLSKQKKLLIPLFYACMAILFLSSYLFVIQPYNDPPAEYATEQVFNITPDNSYLESCIDGSYDLYINNQYVTKIDDILREPFSKLPIKKGRKK